MRNPEATRQLIVEKAMSLFNTQGYRTTSLSDITNATGITKGAIYGNFKNKDEVAEAAFEYAIDIVMSTLRQRIADAPTAPAKMKAIVDYYGDYIQNPPIDGGCPIINTSVEADDNYPQLRSKAVRSVAVMKESMARIIARGIKEGQIDPTVKPEEMALLIYTSIQGAIVLSRVEGNQESYSTIRNYLTRMIESISI